MNEHETCMVETVRFAGMVALFRCSLALLLFEVLVVWLLFFCERCNAAGRKKINGHVVLYETF